MSRPFIDFQEVLAKVPGHIDALVMALIPTARRQGAEYRTGNEQGERGRSFSISCRPNNAGCYHDHANPENKGNAIGLVAICRNLSYEEAGHWLADFVGVTAVERVVSPRQRPVPKINQAGRSMTVGGREVQFTPLTQRSVDYAASRGIHVDVLKAFRCVSTDTSILMPHFDHEQKLVLMKSWSCDGNKTIFTNTDPVPVLFGKDLVNPLKSGGRLIITEGQWDAMSWRQAGVDFAVSIPSGAGNDEWVEEDWNFLNLFSLILLNFDDDEEGLKASSRIKSRLGLERCRNIRLRHKDANAALVTDGPASLLKALHDAENAPIERIVRAADQKDKVRNRINRTHLVGGVPLFLQNINFEFRPHEITLWFGVTSHGKSSILNQQICFAASRGEKCFIASFEQPVDKTLADMLVQYTGDPDIGSSSHFDAAYEDFCSKVIIFDSMLRSSPDELIATMTLAHKQLGVTQFVIDNVMTLDVDRQDNTGQAAVADSFRVFASRFPIHLHEVCHIRKPKDDNAKPPGIHDIMGAAEWSAMSFNVITVWRDVAKHEKVSLMYDEGVAQEEIDNYNRLMPDGKVLVRKQRETGDLPISSYFYERKTKRAYKNPDDLCPYYFPPTEEESGA